MIANDSVERPSWRRAREVFAEVLPAPRGAWPEILDRLCGADRELRGEVEALLEVHSTTVRFLAPPLRAPDASGRTSPPVLPGYELMRILSSGRSRDVWLARDLRSRRECAVKILKRGPPIALEVVRDLLARAPPRQNLLAIEHVAESNGSLIYVVPLADDARDTGLFFDLTEYQPLTLERYLSLRAPLPSAEVLEIAAQLLDGVREVHDAGFTHARLSPAKIVRSEGAWRVGDAGIIANLHRLEPYGLDQDYGPSTGPTDRSADLFAVGRILFRALTWCSFAEFDAILARLARGPDPKARRLAKAIARACAADPEGRLQSTGAMRSSLAAPKRRARIILVAVAAVALGLLLWAGVVWLRSFSD